MTPLAKPKTVDHLVDEVASSSDVHAALEGLVRVILAKGAPAARYTAERQLISAVERTVKAHC